MITARGRVGDVVRGLELGADDYLIKPFNTSELLARVKAILRRAKAPGTPQRTSVYKIRDLELDTDRRIVKVRGQRVDLTPTEFKLLTCFMSNPGRVLPHRYCLVECGDPEYRRSGGLPEAVRALPAPEARKIPPSRSIFSPSGESVIE